MLAEAEALGYEGLVTRRDPVRDYPAARRRRQPGRLPRHARPRGGRAAAGRLRAHLRRAARPAPTARPATRSAAATGSRSATTPSTRPSTARTCTPPSTVDLQWYAQRVLRQAVEDAARRLGHRGRHGHPHRRAPRARRPPDVRRRRRRWSRAGRTSARAAMSDVYEPGSVEKVLTMSVAHRRRQGHAAHQAAGARRGSTARTGRSSDWFAHDTIKLTLAGVLAKSSNIGTVLAADKFSPAELQPLPARLRPRPAAPTSASAARRRASCPAGAAVDRADRGPDRVRPVALGQRRADGRGDQHHRQRRRPGRPEPDRAAAPPPTTASTVGTDTATTRRVISAEAARQTMRMMERVVDPEDGVAPGAAVPGYRVAGKTGTAQRVGEECGCYDGTFTVSFAGLRARRRPALHRLRRGPEPAATAAAAARSAARRSRRS